jgi:sugar O-acyltransferase (sialic acid O-acetyltransferase NeuD family)
VARVVVVGASGHGKKVAEALLLAGEHTVVGFLDSVKTAGTQWFGLEVLGRDDELVAVAARLQVDAAVVGIGDNAARRRVADMLRAAMPDVVFPVVVHPSAVIATGARCGEGAVVMAGAVVGVDAALGAHALVDTGAVLDHDSVLGQAASLAPGAAVAGGVTIGACAAVGIGATVIQGRVIGEHTVVGAGAAVLSDLPGHVVAVGVPARVRRTRAEGERYL